jgi:hypothetical protein
MNSSENTIDYENWDIDDKNGDKSQIDQAYSRKKKGKGGGKLSHE